MLAIRTIEELIQELDARGVGIIISDTEITTFMGDTEIVIHGRIFQKTSQEPKPKYQDYDRAMEVFKC